MKTIIGKGTKIWHSSKSNIYPEDIVIGEDCNIGAMVEIRKDVKIGNGVKIQAFVFIPEGITIEDDVFIGPHVCFTNDKLPKSWKDYIPEKTLIKKGASIGAGAIILSGITVGRYVMVGAGSVVTKDVSDCVTVVGNPAKEMYKNEITDNM